MTSVLTRSKPNCFVHLHQIERKAALHSGSVSSQLERFTEGICGFQLSKAEENATKNLVLFMLLG